VLTGLNHALTAAEAGADKAAKQTKKRLSEITTARAAADAARAAMETARAAGAQANAALRQAETRAAAIKASIEAGDQARSVRADTAALRSVEEIDADLTAKEEQIARAAAALEMLRQCLERDQARALAESLAAEIERLGWAIPLFHDDKKSNHASALNALSQDEQAAFLEVVNARLEPFDARLGVQSGGKTLAVTFGRTDGPMIPVAQISGAEMLLAEWAVATAFAGEEGLVLLDEFNRLDADHRGGVLEAVQTAPSLVLASAYSQATTPDLDALGAALAPIGVTWIGADDAESGEEAA